MKRYFLILFLTLLLLLPAGCGKNSALSSDKKALLVVVYEENDIVLEGTLRIAKLEDDTETEIPFCEAAGEHLGFLAEVDEGFYEVTWELDGYTTAPEHILVHDAAVNYVTVNPISDN